MALDQKALDTKVLESLHHIESGSDTISSVSTTEKSVQVNFDHTFVNPPVVVISLATASYNRRISANNITATSFEAVGALTSGGPANIVFNWIAMGGGTP